MTVIQTMAGGAGGSGQVIDATGSIYNVTGTLIDRSKCIVFIQSDDMGYPEISIDGKILKTVNAYAQSRPDSVYKMTTTTIINNIKSGLENLLPDLPDGQYIIVTTGCGSNLSAGSFQAGRTTYWTLTVSSGVYSLSYSGDRLMFYDSSQAYIRLLSIAKIS